MSVEDELKEGKDTIDGMDGIVLPVAKGVHGGTDVEHGPVDDGDDEVVGDNGRVEEPVGVAPAGGAGFEPRRPGVEGLAEVVD
jgi:hypothetical protein